MTKKKIYKGSIHVWDELAEDGERTAFGRVIIDDLMAPGGKHEFDFFLSREDVEELENEASVVAMGFLTDMGYDE